MDERRKQAFMNRASREPFSNILGIRLVDVREGYAVCEMEYTERLDNIHEIAHGGAIFSLIDEAFEISSNTHGTTALALNMNVTFVRMALKNSILRAESTETNRVPLARLTGRAWATTAGSMTCFHAQSTWVPTPDRVWQRSPSRGDFSANLLQNALLPSSSISGSSKRTRLFLLRMARA